MQVYFKLISANTDFRGMSRTTIPNIIHKDIIQIRHVVAERASNPLSQKLEMEFDSWKSWPKADQMAKHR